MIPQKYWENAEKKTGIEITLRDAQLMSKIPLEISFDFEFEDFAFIDNKIVDGKFELPWGEDKNLRFRQLQRKTNDSDRLSKEAIVNSLVQKAVDHVVKEMTARVAKK